MRRMKLPLIVMALAATVAADAGWERDAVLDYEAQNVIFGVSHFLEDGRHAWVSAVKPPYDPGLVVIFRTTDGGASWERIDTALEGEPRQIDFVDASNGWLVTYTNTQPMRTSDGGRTWRAESCIGGWATNSIHDLQMLSATEGYGSGQTGDRGCFFSYDGTTWRALPGPDINIALHTMDAKDATHMWAIGTGRADTRAYGRIGSEEVVRLDVGIFPCAWSVHFFDRNHGWIGAGETIVHTTDGGRTWEEQDVWTLQAVRAIKFTSPTVGRACTNLGELLRTSDGGVTWRNDRITSGALKDVDHWQGNWQITGIQGLFAVQKPQIRATMGGGSLRPPRPPQPQPAANLHERNWQPMSSLDAARGNATINSAAFHGDSHIWLGAQERGLAMVLFTHDAGSTWRRVPLPLPAPTIHDIEFVNERVGWLTCTGDPAVWHTTDGGHTWTGQSYDRGWAEHGRVTDLNMLDPTMGYAVYFAPGAGSRLLYWTSGSGLWSERDTGINDEFFRLWFQDANHCWLMKNASLGWRGTGGWRFAPMTTGAPGAIGCVFGLDGDWGWMGGQNRIMRTTNNGQSWQEQSAPLRDRRAMVEGIFFRDRNRGCAVSSHGDILITGDGGANWRQTAPATTIGFELTSLKDVAWFGGGWTVVGAYGVYQAAAPIATMALGARLRSAPPVASELRWYGRDAWVDRGHMRPAPEVGSLDHFRVTYTDRNEDEPREVMLVITDPTGATERRNMYPHHDGDYLTGKTYERAYGWALNGTYRYHFEATDSTGSRATGPATVEQTIYVARPGEPRY